MRFVTVFWVLTSLMCQGQEIIIDEREGAPAGIIRDSVGNILSPKQAREMLKTGKYISVPVITENMQVEHVIRRPKPQDGDRYKTYGSGETIISTTGLSHKTKRSPGDTLSGFLVNTRTDETKTVEQLPHEFSLLRVSGEGKKLDADIANRLALLIDNYPRVNYIFSGTKSWSSIDSRLLTQVMKRHQNGFLTESNFSSDFEGSPWYIVIDRKRVVVMFIPPLPNEIIALEAIAKVLKEKDRVVPDKKE